MNEFFKNKQTVLFQGDSITDSERDRENDDYLGYGYVSKVKAAYNALFPDNEVKFINRGTSCDMLCDMINRYESDVLALKPDFISLLIGINDIWRKYSRDVPFSLDNFKEQYELLLSNIKKDLPNTKIMIIEPYLMNTDPEKVIWRANDLDPTIQVIRNLAVTYADYYLPLDGILTGYKINKYSDFQISDDGVHPTQLGHGLIATEYLKTLNII
ncbi:MAG: GDSL-type esterase/lipase family protein [Oscillospiraceae bacterium]